MRKWGAKKGWIDCGFESCVLATTIISVGEPESDAFTLDFFLCFVGESGKGGGSAGGGSGSEDGKGSISRNPAGPPELAKFGTAQR